MCIFSITVAGAAEDRFDNNENLQVLNDRLVSGTWPSQITRMSIRTMLGQIGVDVLKEMNDVVEGFERGVAV